MAHRVHCYSQKEKAWRYQIYAQALAPVCLTEHISGKTQRTPWKPWLSLQEGTDGCKQAENAVVAICPFAPYILPKSHPGSMLPKGNQQGTLLSCGTAFLTPAPSNIDFSDSYTRRSQTTVPTCCFPPNPQCPTLCLAHGVLGKGLGWEAPARPVSGLPCLPGSRQKPELALHSGGWGEGH